MPLLANLFGTVRRVALGLGRESAADLRELGELLAQLREDPPASTAAVLERWRDRPEHGSLAKLAMTGCLAPDEAGAAAELRAALNRLITEESPAHRLDELQAKAADSTLDEAEKQELRALLAARGQASRRSPPAQ
jgi:hypothetical protein